MALDGDGVNILVRTDQHWSLAEQLAGAQAPTHLGRVLHELGIAIDQQQHLGSARDSLRPAFSEIVKLN